MAEKKRLEFTIEGARIGFRNFEGAEGRYNPKGNRNFVIFLPTDIAQEMEKDAFLIKWLVSDEYDEPQAILHVAVAFGNYPPNVVLVSDGKLSRLDETNINILDFADLENVDLTVRGYTWSAQGKTGVKAYLKTGYFTLRLDPLAAKYSDSLDSAQESVGGCGDCDVCDGQCGGGLATEI